MLEATHAHPTIRGYAACSPLEPQVIATIVGEQPPEHQGTNTIVGALLGVNHQQEDHPSLLNGGQHRGILLEPSHSQLYHTLSRDSGLQAQRLVLEQNSMMK